MPDRTLGRHQRGGHVVRHQRVVAVISEKLQVATDEWIDRSVRHGIKAVIKVELRDGIDRKAERSAIGSICNPHHDGFMPEPRIDAVETLHQFKKMRFGHLCERCRRVDLQDVPMASNFKLKVSTPSPDAISSELSRAEPLHHGRIAMVEEAAGFLVERGDRCDVFLIEREVKD